MRRERAPILDTLSILVSIHFSPHVFSPLLFRISGFFFRDAIARQRNIILLFIAINATPRVRRSFREASGIITERRRERKRLFPGERDTGTATANRYAPREIHRAFNYRTGRNYLAARRREQASSEANGAIRLHVVRRVRYCIAGNAMKKVRIHRNRAGGGGRGRCESGKSNDCDRRKWR